MPPDLLLDAATQKHRAGELHEARRLYLLAVAESPVNPLALFRLGLLELQEGHADAALPLIAEAVGGVPTEFRFQFGLGQVLAALARWPEAVAAYRAALRLDGNSADAHFSLGNALAAAGDHAGAVDSLQSAVRIQPNFADAFLNLGNAWRHRDDLPQAVAAYDRALALRPHSAAALSNLGVALLALTDRPRAMECLRGAVIAEPNVATYAINLAAALSGRREFVEAAALLQNVIAREPDNAQAAFNFGIAMQGMGKSTEAIEQYRRTISLAPDHVDAFNNLGNLLKERGQFATALSAFESAIQINPRFVPAMNNAGCLLRTLGRLEEAEAMLRRGLAVDDRQPALLDNLGSVLKDAGNLDEAIECFRRSLAVDPTSAGTHGNLAFSLGFLCNDPQLILDECRRWGAMHADPLLPETRLLENDRSPTRRLRIGYASPDFREHCQSLFTIPLLSNHDHQSFEIFCYSSVERPDAVTRRIAGYADVWREVRHLDDAALARQIREDRIDILIDLTMHMASGRPLVFARKPAPVQIAWLAYPGTTGMGAMDYRLSDPRLDPPGFDSHYTERTIRLPDAFWCYDPLADQPKVNDLPAMSRGLVTFGCLNNPCKLTDETLRLWGGVLRALPTARLLLMTPPGAYRQRLLDRLAAQAIASDRVEFLSYRPRADYLRSYHQIDLGLDTFPYNGHTTSLDSFWMGVPVVTRVGNTCVGRGGLSQLHQLNLLALAAESDDAFVKIAADLASDLPRLAALRKQLRSRLEKSPLMDGKRFAGNMEAVYRRCWMSFLENN